MLHFRSPAVENELPPSLDPRGGAFPGLGPMASPDFAVSGIAQASVLETARGPVLARDLHAADRIVTRDHGLVPVRWVGSNTVMYPENEAAQTQPTRGPVRIRAGAHGTDENAGNLLLAPGHRVLVRNVLNELLFATDEVMTAIGDLTHLEGVDFVPRSMGRWTHVLFDTHEMIRVNGIWIESFTPDMWSIRVGFPEEWSEITDALPRLRYDNGDANYVEARLALDPREARLLDGF